MNISIKRMSWLIHMKSYTRKLYSIYTALCYDCALEIYLEIFLTHLWILNVVQNWLQKLIFENIIAWKL